MKNWYVALIASSWFLFALIVFFFPPAWSGILNVLVSIVGLFGMASALSFLVSKRSGFLSSCIAGGAALVLLFAVRWWSFIHDYIAVDPEPNVLIAAWLFIKTRLIVPIKIIADGFPMRAFIEFYWGIGMPILQLGIVTFAIARLRKLNVLSSNKK